MSMKSEVEAFLRKNAGKSYSLDYLANKYATTVNSMRSTLAAIRNASPEFDAEFSIPAPNAVMFGTPQEESSEMNIETEEVEEEIDLEAIKSAFEAGRKHVVFTICGQTEDGSFMLEDSGGNIWVGYPVNSD